jgi:hypothetical protein
MGYFEDQIEALVCEMELKLQRHSQELAVIPDERIWRAKNGKKSRVYIVVRQNGRCVRRTMRTSGDLIPSLRRKFTAACAIQDRKRLAILREAMVRLRAVRPEEELLDEVLAVYRDIAPDGIRLDVLSNGLFSEWERAPYKTSDYRPEGKRFRTSRGLLVRSKSEVMIAEMLYAYRLPFRYEQLLEVDGASYAPDFTVMRPDGSIAYWEHMGKVGDLRYYDRQLTKLRAYYTVGVVPWKNLIVSYDDDEGSLDTASIRALIKDRIFGRTPG